METLPYLNDLYVASDGLLQIFLKNSKEPLRTAQLPGFLEKWDKYVKARRALKSWLDGIKGPVFAAIDLTYKCNLKCPYCYVSAPLRKSAPELPTEIVLRAIDELGKLETLGICLCGGEPVLHREFFRIIEYANDAGIPVNFVTNGTLITEEFAKKLSELNIGSVQVSLDGSKPEIMDRLRGNGIFHRAVDSIKRLIDYGINTSVAFCATRINIQDFPNVVELASKLGVFEVRSMYFVPETEAHIKLAPSESQYKELLQWIYDNRENFTIKVDFGDPTEHIILGPYINSVVITISAEGYILPTPYLNFAYGHVTDGIEALWPELREAWKQNPVLLTVSSYLKTEKDFVKLNNVGLTRKNGRGYIDLSRISTDQQLELSRKIRSVLI